LFHIHRFARNRKLFEEAINSIKDGVDVVVVLVDGSRRLDQINHLIKALEKQVTEEDTAMTSLEEAMAKFNDDKQQEAQTNNTANMKQQSMKQQQKEQAREANQREKIISDHYEQLSKGALDKKKTKLIAVINKTDLVYPRDRIFELGAELRKSGLFYDVFWLSALKNEGIQEFKDFLKNKCSRKHAWEFAPTQVSNLSMEQRLNEITREKLFKRLNAEIPYQVVVTCTKFDHKEATSLFIEQTVWCNTVGQKRIVQSALKFVHERALYSMKLMFPSVPEDKIFLNFAVRVGKPISDAEKEEIMNQQMQRQRSAMFASQQDPLKM